jgi:hypothetical protein
MRIFGLRWRVRPLHLALGLLALANGGCLAVAAGVAAGGAAGYAYYAGKVDRAYPASFADTWAATRTALAELGMPIVSEERHATDGTIESRTADDDKVHISLETAKSQIPAEGTVTDVSIRVRLFGDKPVSERILYQIAAHLAPPRTVAVPPLVTPPPRPTFGPPVQPTAATARGASNSEPPLDK